MKQFLKTCLFIFFALFVFLLLVQYFDKGKISVDSLFVLLPAAIVLSPILSLKLLWGDEGFSESYLSEKKPKSKLMVCRHCGFMGADTGICPRCGRGHTEKITEKTVLMSCLKCGYLGPHTGVCPRCGWSRTEKITEKTSIISCRHCGYLGAGSGVCPRCGWNMADRIR